MADEGPSRESTVNAEVRAEPDGTARLVLRGRLDLESAGRCWRELEQRLHGLRARTLAVDVSQLELHGGIGIALLRYLKEGGMSPGVSVNITGLTEGPKRLLTTFSSEDYRAYQGRVQRHVSWPEEVGAFTRGMLADLREQVTFVGSVLRVMPGALLHPRWMRWGEVRRVMESAGANALPLVGAVSWLVGLVMALESVRPLERFGAQWMIADMIGFSALRDTGPIVTGIMLASRSGSALTAELATMKVNEELDALKTMGLEPIRFLVVQRVLAALLLTPLVTVYSMLMGIIGGVMIMRLMGFPPRMIYSEMLAQLTLGDLLVGITKSLIFGLIIGAVSCLRGLQTGEGPEAVGVSTKRCVVASIMLIIISNTLYSTANYLLSSP